MARRLPVYLLLDTSGSMYGEPIEAVRNAMQILLSELQGDPNALETAYLSVITFNDTPSQIVPLTDISSVQLPDIEAGGGTALGAALQLLADKLKTELKQNEGEIKGDWKPLIFLMTDGMPTDSIENGIQAIKSSHTGTFVACAAGPKADPELLKRITPDVVQLDNLDSTAIKKFIKWVSQSIKVASVRAGDNMEKNGLDALPEPPASISIV